MSTQPTDAMIEAGDRAMRESLAGFVEGLDYSKALTRIYLAMQSARTPPPCAGDDVERLRKLSRDATPGEWFTDNEDCDTGHGNVMTLSIYSDGLMSYGKPAKLFDALNSDAMLVEHDDDEYGRLFDRTSYANAEFVVACVNFTRDAIAARTPPPCAGDDVERAYKDGFCEGFEHRGKNDDPLAALTGAERGWTHRAAIAALGTTPSIVGQEPVRKRPGEFTGQAYRENL